MRLARALVAAVLGTVLGPAMAAEPVRLTPVRPAVLTDAPRIGLNLGGASTWGAEQLPVNVLKNPGFEAPIERALVIVKQIADASVTDDTPWVARADGWWNGAEFEVLSGAAAGRRGKVATYRRAGNGAGEFRLTPFPAGLRPSDGLSVTTTHAGSGVPMWWTAAGAVGVAEDARPGSPGRQSARLVAGPNAPSRLAHHLDMLERAGKLLPVRGAWRLEFWARGEAPGQRLSVAFRRHGSAAFIAREIALEPRWQHIVLPFAATDDGPYGALELAFEVRSGAVNIDDLFLGEAADATAGFRLAVVEALRALRPGYLRDWQGQLADTFDNRVAGPWQRRPTRHRAGDAELIYHYSLPEFLDLCAAVGARPWVVAPPLMTMDDWRRMGELLAASARRHGFDEVLVEFGNENWNALFRPAGFLTAETHAEVADRAFAQLRRGAGTYGGIVPVVNAQFVNTASWRKLASLTREAQRIAVAPYFLYRLDEVSRQEAVAAAFEDVVPALRQGMAGAGALGKRVSVYEVNFHTTEGNATPALRDLAVSGAHAGAALARQLLGDLLAGAREQAVYALAGFDAYTADRKLVRLWGVTRDLAGGPLRPTGLALAMLNGAIDGDAHATNCSGSATVCANLTAAWFERPRLAHLVVASRDARTVRVQTGLPCQRSVAVSLLDGSDSARNNESGTGVQVQSARATCEREWTFDLPARSVAVVRAQVPGSPEAR